MTVSARSLRHRLLIGASLASLSLAGTAYAQNLGAGRMANPAAAAAQASQNAAQRNAAAHAAAARTRAAFEQASRVRQQMDAAQAAAREAALAAQSNVPNGLGAGGLQVANGVELDPSLWVGANGPTQSQGQNGRTNVTIEQTQEKAILTWDSFNVGRETDLAFDQQGNANWIALNRVTSASADPTQILGSVKADGSVYIINPNGVIFGGASQVNVRNLIASTLEIHGGAIEYTRPSENGLQVSDERWEELKKAGRDQKFMDGIFGNNAQDSNGDYRGQMTFWDGVSTGLTTEELTAERAEAAQSTAPGVTVAAGARIDAANSGLVMLVGRNVDNSGTIASPGGQVLLAAGRGVTMIDGNSRVLGSYALASDDRTDADLFKIPGYIAVVQQGGRTSNDGLIVSTRGNISMVGSAVIQNGLLAATTGVDKAGSIILDASSLTGLSGFNPTIRGDAVGAGVTTSWRGEVTIGAGSHISILPDDETQTAVGATFTPSDIEIVGNNITFEQNSVLWAPGASLYLTADGISTSSLANQTPGRIYLDKGATIDVGGLNGIEIAMEQNSVRAELRANELADNPVVRDGELRGETVYFDGRLGGNLTAEGDGVADLSGWYDLIQRDVTQFMTTGGSVTMKGAEIITREGSVIDISGGSVQYQDGFVRRTRLIDSLGRLVPIEAAIAGVNYVGIEGDSVVNHARWGVTERFENPFARVSQGSWEQGYVEGRSAGSLAIRAGVNTATSTIDGFVFTGDLARIFEGELRAGVLVGENQVNAPTGAGITDMARIWNERPSLATLTIGETYRIGNNPPVVKGGDITIADRMPVLGEDFTAGSMLFDRDQSFASVVDGVETASHILPTSWFDGETFGNVTLYSGDGIGGLRSQADNWALKPNAPSSATGGMLTIGAGVTVDLGDYGAFNFIGRQANIDGTIRAAGGSVKLDATYLPKLGGTAAPDFGIITDSLRPGVTLGGAAVIDVAGRWTNNYLEALNGEPLTNAVVDGGSVELESYRITLTEGSLIDVSGGASLGTDGSTLTLGDAGTVTLDLDTSGSIGLQTGGELVADGQILGHAPGKGGTLNVYTPWTVVIADEIGDLAIITDGVLEAGTAAPIDLQLETELVIPAGAVLPIATSYTTNRLSPGETLTSSTGTVVSAASPLVIAAEWTLPEFVRVLVGDVIYGANDPGGPVVPAGASITAVVGSLPAGFVVSPEIFPDGIPSYNRTVEAPAGSIAPVDITIAAGAVIGRGAVLDQDVSVRNDFRLVSPTFFQGGKYPTITDQWGADVAPIADGVLETGTAAPQTVRLVAPLVIPSGDPLPVDTSYLVGTLPLDEALPAHFPVSYLGYDKPITLEADWEVPTGISLRTSILVDGVYVNSGELFRAGARLPAGTKIGWLNGTLSSGTVIPSAAFSQGLPLSSAVTLQAAKGDVIRYDAMLAAGTLIEAGTVLPNDARVAFAGRLANGKDFHDGFANFALTGAEGLTVSSGAVIAPTHDTLQLTGAVRDIATGARLTDLAGVAGSGVSLVRSTELPEWQRQTTQLMLGTQGVRNSGWRGFLSATNPGSLTMEAGSEIRLTPGSRVSLNASSNKRLFVDGTIEALGGRIMLQEVQPEYNQFVSVLLGDNARLLAGGYQAVTGYADGREIRGVVAGGDIIVGNIGDTNSASYRVVIGEGALLDVSGVAGVADLPPGAGAGGLDRTSPLVEAAVHGAGGSIVFNVVSGLVAGNFDLSPGGETGLGGRLVFQGSNAIEVHDAIADLGPVTAGNIVPTATLTLSAERLNASGADDLAISSDWGFPAATSSMTFDGPVTLSARRSLVLESGSFAANPGADVALDSAYVRLTGWSYSGADSTATVAEGSSLTVRGGVIDLIQNVQLGRTGATGFESASFIADGDIRLIGGRATESAGSLQSPGTILFDAAQTYVAPGTGNMGSGALEYLQYEWEDTNPGFLVSAGESVEFRSNGGAAPVPLSWGGKLTVRAPEITQAGVLRAPLGTIALEAQDRTDEEGNVIAGRLTLAPGSLTSVSLEGSTALAGLMSYTQTFYGYNRADWAPSKSVVLSGANVDVQGDAVVDLSGGGDLVGYNFVSGSGGVTNILEASEDGAFAILPDYDGPLAAPTRTSTIAGTAGWMNNPGAAGSTYNEGAGTSDERLRVGDQVWLQGVPGLADGYYTLLPAAYALLDGGMLVKPAQSTVSAGAQAVQRRDDGSVIASGYRAVAGTAIRPDQGWTSFQVMDGETWRQYSEIVTYSMNAVRSASNAQMGYQVRIPHDAGRLVIDARDSLNLLGEARLAGAAATDDLAAGMAGDVDISNAGGGIALVMPGQSAPEGYLAVDAATVADFAGSGSLLLGGRRPLSTRVPTDANNRTAPATDAVAVTTTATDVLVGEGVRYQGLELLLAATDSIVIGENAQLTAAGSGVVNDSALSLSGDGALVRLSSGARVGLDRTDSTGASGSLTIDSGAVLESAGGLSLDASAGFDLAQDALLDVGSLDLASDRLVIGDAPVGTAGTLLSLDTIERLAGASDLLLRGHQGIAVYGDVVLGGRGADGAATLVALTLDTPLLEGFADASEGLTLTAGALTLRNSGAAAAGAAGTGTLTLDVDQLVLGEGAVGIGGYGALAGTVGEVRTATEGTLDIAGNADLAVGRFAVATGSDYALSASGMLNIAKGAAPADASTDGLLGGALALSGASLRFDTTLVAQGGKVSLTATDGDLALGADARLDLTGAAKDYIDVARYAPGGVVSLAASGDVVADAASVIDVSGHERGGDAGAIDVRAGGRADLAGTLRADSIDEADGGEFALDAGSADFAALNASLNAGRFTASRDIRLDESITLAGGETIEAHKVTLRSDNGAVTIAGTIAASGDAAHADGGQVALIGRDVTLTGTGRIEAAAASIDAADYQPASGAVTLAADEGRVVLASGSTIDVSGGREGGGRLMVRAQRTAGGADADLAGTVTGAREKLLLGSRVYGADTVDAALVTSMLNDASNWLSEVSTPTGWTTGAGIVVRGADDLTVADDIDLARIGGAGWLGLEAGNDLIIDASISDGFSSAAADAALADRASFSYGFEAGRDIVLGEMAPVPVKPVIGPGQAFDKDRLVSAVVPFTVAADWEVPTGVYVYTSAGYKVPGTIVPAGATVTNVNGTRYFPAGYVLPADAFPDGLTFAMEKIPFTGEGRIVRTGTGDISVNAGRDLQIGAQSVIYTAGSATPTEGGFDRSGYVTQRPDGSTSDRVLGDFPTMGGNLTIAAGRNIDMSPIEQTPTAWLFRYGSSTWNGNPAESLVAEQTSWSIVYRNYQFGLGALGGGNIAVRAGGDISNLAAAIPTTGHMTRGVGERAVDGDIIVRGGGDLAIRALGDIAGGAFVLGKGHAELVAGGDVRGGAPTLVPDSNPNLIASANFVERGLAPMFGLMDAQVSVIAGGSAEIENAYDLALMPQICENLVGTCGTVSAAGSGWIGLSERAVFDALAVGGDLVYRANGTGAVTLSRDSSVEAFRVNLTAPPRATVNAATPYLTLMNRVPGTFKLTSVSGDILFQPPTAILASPILSPAPRGTLELLAADSVVFDRVPTGSFNWSLSLEDRGVDYIRDAFSPAAAIGQSGVAMFTLSSDNNTNIANNNYRGYDLLHADDPEPVRIYALEGSIGKSALSGVYDNWYLTTPKAARIQAGGDIDYAQLQFTHNDPTDVSTVIAGGDLYSGSQGGYWIWGPGTLWIEAGGNILHPRNAGRFVSAGNGSSITGYSPAGSKELVNHALPDVGANITMVAGTAQGSNYDAFADLYFDPANLANPEFGLSHPTNQGKVVQTYEAELEEFLEGLGFADVTAENRRELFDNLPAQTREGFLHQVLLKELQQTGIDYNDDQGPRFQQYTRGYAALNLMFPGTEDLGRDNPLGGDILLQNSLVDSRSGGSITLVAPYGRIGIGNPADPAVPNDAGLLTRRGGNVRLLANGTISLDQSRAFTMQGGDLMMWTSYGDITAGVGAKTNVSNVPLRFLLNKDGLLAVNVFGLQTGAGIGVLDAFEGRDPNRRPSRMDLLAFFGEVNAGDAGIRVVGDINIAALRVVNAANIEVSGDAVGIPDVPVVNVGALTAASSATSAIVNQAAQLAERSRPQVRTDVPAIVNVRFVGFGE